MYNEVFKRIIHSSQTNSLTFFVGAGVSALSNAPKWSDLIDKICNELNIKKQEQYTADQCLQIPQIFYCSIDKDDKKYYEFIDKCLDNTKLQPNEIHKRIFNLNPISIVTTNFDDLLEKASIQSCKSYKVIASDQEISSINGNKFILKLHGDMKHKNIVFKEEDYLNYSNDFKLTETMLKSIFATNTVVFIGYGLNDYNIKLILNWAKRLLKDKFNKPIFIYTDNKELSSSELQYQQEKGLIVIEYQKLLIDEKEETEYIDRYKCILNEIEYSSRLSVNGKNKYELFEILYELILPLSKLNSLRTQDLHRKLSPNLNVDESGVIFVYPDGKDILTYYIELNNMLYIKNSILDKKVIDKYNTITSVFSKARIHAVKVDGTIKHIKGLKLSFADSKCIEMDFLNMLKYIQQNKKGIKSRFRQAYYLARLGKYKESFEMFSVLAIDSYNDKDYLNFYLCQMNKNYLLSTFSSLRYFYSKTFDLEEYKKSENAFEELPVEFKSQYANLKDLNSGIMLYKNAYDSFMDGKKLQNTIESNSIEWGLTNANKVICRINNNLHFLLGNGLYIDKFVEFENTISNLMSLLVYKYSTQEKTGDLPSIFQKNHDKIMLDELDFFCFVEYFKSTDLDKTLNKYDIEYLEFKNMKVIEQSVRNLLEYYAFLIKNKASSIEVRMFQCRLNSCFCLLNHIKLSQTIVDELCSTIFKHEFENFCIDNKIKLLYSLLYKQKKYSEVTKKAISDALFNYIDKNILAEKKGESFTIPSTSSNIDYPVLIHYTNLTCKGTLSRKLSLRVNIIINNNYTSMYKSIYQHYFDYLTESQKKNVIKWIKGRIEESFELDFFVFLINIKQKIGRQQIKQLKDFLRNEHYSDISKLGIKTYPFVDEYENLKNVGYWILLNILPRKEFSEFVGLNDNFDFYYYYDDFEFDKFDISWLYNLKPKTYEAIAENVNVRNKIKLKIIESLLAKTLSASEKNELNDILIKYFAI